MTVSELVEKLKEFPQDAVVIFDDAEDGDVEVTEVSSLGLMVLGHHVSSYHKTPYWHRAEGRWARRPEVQIREAQGVLLS